MGAVLVVAVQECAAERVADLREEIGQQVVVWQLFGEEKAAHGWLAVGGALLVA